VVVDTTVQPKAIAHPTDARLCHRALEKLVDLAERNNVPLRQSYRRVAKPRRSWSAGIAMPTSSSGRDANSSSCDRPPPRRACQKSSRPPRRKPRRVVAKVEWHPGELCPRVGFIVTNLARPAERIVAFYNHRGTCEQYIKEGKGAIKWTRLSCRSFAFNSMLLPTTWETSCGRWQCPRRRSRGR
jgi:hypothetical protein